MEEYEPTVFIVDDDEAVCQSLSMLIETVDLNVQTYHSGQEFLDTYGTAQTGCLVLDVRMPGISGLELQSKLVAEGFNIPVIIITGHGDVPMAVQAIKAGALDFIEKPFRNQVLLDNVQKAIELDAKNRHNHLQEANIAAKLALLTPREQEIVDLLMAGESNKAIAYDLGISPRTVDFHRLHIMKKMGVDSLVGLVRLIQKLDLVEATAEAG